MMTNGNGSSGGGGGNSDDQKCIKTQSTQFYENKLGGATLSYVRSNEQLTGNFKLVQYYTYC